jgi:hypothetical protein
MRLRLLAMAIMGLGLALCASAPAKATLLTCTTTYESANGTTTFPGTSLGTIGTGCLQVGGNGTGAGAINDGPPDVNTTISTSIYEFYFTGGTMTVDEAVGNNGIGYNIDVELDSLSGSGSTSPSSTLASIQIPYSSGPTYDESTVYSGTLAAGWYAVDTYLGTCGNASECQANNSGVTDPDYQLNFVDQDAPAAPEPSSIAMLGTGLLALFGLAGFVRRRADGVQVG